MEPPILHNRTPDRNISAIADDPPCHGDTPTRTAALASLLIAHAPLSPAATAQPSREIAAARNAGTDGTSLIPHAGAADLNNDGAVDGTDLLILLNSFGAGG